MLSHGEEGGEKDEADIDMDINFQRRIMHNNAEKVPLTRLGDMRMRDGGVEREGNEEGGHEGEDQDTNIEIMESKSMDVQEGEIGSENIVDQLPIMEIPENSMYKYNI